MLSIEEYQKRFPDIDVNNKMKKFLAYKNNPKHNDALQWLGNEKRKKKPQNSNNTKLDFLRHFVQNAGIKRCHQINGKIKAGSSCCKVEYVPLKPKF